MDLSQRGLELIQSFEGYHTAQPDGSCVAYLCPAKVPTIGWGCTEGVRLGMRWTRKEADAAFKRELSKFEAAVNRLVTVDLNQNEFDALVSFAYNCGEGALAKSTILKKLNKNDRTGAAAAFHVWNKGGGRVLNGLVRRRREEAELFLEPLEPAEEIMPQAVEASMPPVSGAVKGSLALSGGAVAVKGAEAMIATPPPVVTDTVANVEMWVKIGKTAESLSTGLWKSPVFAASLFAVAVAVIWGSWAYNKVKS
jgi:lysozyme